MKNKTKNKFISFIAMTLFFALAIAFIIRYAGPSFIRFYLEAGVGKCNDIPVLCMAPSEEITNPEVNKEFIAELIPYTFPKITLSLPKGFTVTHELIHKTYFKKWGGKKNISAAFLLSQEPGYFIAMFPQVTRLGIKDNYEFIKRMMYTREDQVENTDDAFFLIMKSIFLPNLGDQAHVRMAHFTNGEHKGIISYNTEGPDHYFNCNIFDKEGNFFAVYIKDKGGKLSLPEIFAIISTVKP